MEECEKFKSNPNMYRICRGESSLPKYKIDRYRVTWGLSPLYNESCPERKEIKVTVSNDPYNNVGIGPGAELLEIYKAAGIPACPDCFNLAKTMNSWGKDLCEKNIDVLVEEIFPRAKEWVKTNKPWVHALLPGIVEDAGIRMKVKSDLKLAISRAPQQTRHGTLSPMPAAVKKKCNCG